MHAIIVGGAGFIGKFLCRALPANWELTVVDNYTTSDYWESLPAVVPPNISFLEADIRDTSWHHKVSRPDIIINLACPASVGYYLRHQLDTFDSSVTGTRNLIEWALKIDALYVHASTSETYGSLAPIQSEQDAGICHCYSERSCYGEGKRAAETLIYMFQDMGLRARIVRIFNSYGPDFSGQDCRIVPMLMRAVSEKEIEIYGSGEQTRSFCYVTDTTEGIVRLIQSDYDKPVNIGNPVETTINELVEIVQKVTGSPLEVRYTELPKGDPPRRRPDTTVAKEVLNWTPTVSLTDGIRSTWEWYREHGV